MIPIVVSLVRSVNYNADKAELSSITVSFKPIPVLNNDDFYVLIMIAFLYTFVYNFIVYLILFWL
jgi:hypothetical protein